MSGQNLLPEAFSHIYVENRAFGYEMTEKILSSFGKSTIVRISHYKDVFNRPGQDPYLQNKSKNLIIAVNDGNRFFEGSPVCQDFGFERFYYAESAMNCPFSCDYCFLKGMYHTANVVMFVNSDDYLEECDRMLKDGPMYLCASFDTDLAALSGICEWKKIWERYASVREDLTLELRTKACVNEFVAKDNVIYAFTLSPEEIIRRFERNTPSLDSRIRCINKALESGAAVRLCFDPMIYIKDYELCYNEFADKILEKIDITEIKDFGIGTFRISSDYLSSLRAACPGSAAVLFPFDREDGFCVYPKDLRTKMTGIIENRLKKAGCGERVFVMS